MLFRFQVARWTRKILRESGAYSPDQVGAIWSDERNARWVRETKKAPGMNDVLNSAVVAALTVTCDLYEDSQVTEEQLAAVLAMRGACYDKYLFPTVVTRALAGDGSSGWHEATGGVADRARTLLESSGQP